MTHAEIRKLALPAIKHVAQMGIWDGVNVAYENGEPVVVAILHRPPLIHFLSKIAAMKHALALPSLPDKIKGIRCRVEVQATAKPR